MTKDNGYTRRSFVKKSAVGLTASLVAQSTYTAQLIGVITDSSGGVIAGCRLTLNDEGTGVASTATTDAPGTGAAVGWDAT